MWKRTRGCSERGDNMQKTFGKKKVILMFLLPAFVIYTLFVVVSVIWAG